jgi:hypothetical protein
MLLIVQIAIGILFGYFMIKHYGVFYAPFHAFVADFLFWIVIVLGTPIVFMAGLYLEWSAISALASDSVIDSWWGKVLLILALGLWFSLGITIAYAFLASKLYDSLKLNVARKDDPFNLKN